VNPLPPRPSAPGEPPRRRRIASKRHAKGGLRVGPNNDAVTLEQLESRMRDELAKNPKLALAVNADKNAPWGQIVKVMDAAKAVNIKTVSAFTKETGKS